MGRNGYTAYTDATVQRYNRDLSVAQGQLNKLYDDYRELESLYNGLDEDADKRPEVEQEILLSEMTHAFRKFIDVSRNGRGFTSIVFGMGQLSDEGVAKKIAEQISAIAFTAPHMLHMEKEFALLQEAAKRAFRAEYPNREHFLKKL